jgi:hypothetical protein
MAGDVVTEGCGSSPRKILGIAFAAAVAFSTRPLKTVVVAPSLAKLSRIFVRVVDGDESSGRKMPPADLTVIEGFLDGVSGAGVDTAGAAGTALGADDGGTPRRNSV